MDATHFDRLTKALSTPGARRGLLQFLTALPFLGGLAARFGEDAEAKGRHKRRKKRHKHGKGRRRKHHKKPCKPNSTAKTCAGKCGSVKNNCQKTVDCGSCACDPPCDECFVCNETTRTCDVDPDQQGNPCGSTGQVCQSNGACACSADPATCPACTTCGGDGTCQGCSGCCDANGDCQDGDTNAACGNSGTCEVCTGQEECQNQSCVCIPDCAGKNCGPDGCGEQCPPGCPPNSTCSGEGTSCSCDFLTCDDACCAQNQLCCDDQCVSGTCCSSATCANPTPICSGNHTCTTCATDGECTAAGKGDLCCSGECVSGICCAAGECQPTGNACVDHQCHCGSGSPCDGSGSTPDCCGSPGSCTNTNTDANNCGSCGGGPCSGGTPVCWNGTCVCGDVCADGCQFTSIQDAIAAADAGDTITICAGTFVGNLTIATDLTLVGAGADATTLQGDGTGTVVKIAGGIVTIKHLRITGGAAFIGGGIHNSGTLQLTDCTVSGNTNHAFSAGGGISNNGTLTLTDCTVSGNTAVNAGGIYNDGTSGGGRSTCTDSDVSGNTPNDCVAVAGGDCDSC